METETLKVHNESDGEGGCDRWMLILADTKEEALDHFIANFGGYEYTAPGYWFQHEPHCADSVGVLYDQPIWCVTQYCGLDI